MCYPNSTIKTVLMAGFLYSFFHFVLFYITRVIKDMKKETKKDVESATVLSAQLTMLK